jgi:hypothetical protein
MPNEPETPNGGGQVTDNEEPASFFLLGSLPSFYVKFSL